MDEILNIIKTKDDVRVLDREIDLLIESLYKAPRFDEVVESYVRESTAQMVKNLGPDKEKRLRDLKSQIEKLEYISLTLSHEPTPKTINKIVDWLRNNVNTMAVVDIHIQENTVAGAIIEYKGKYGDYSLAKGFSEKSIEIKGKIEKVLNIGA